MSHVIYYETLIGNLYGGAGVSNYVMSDEFQ